MYNQLARQATLIEKILSEIFLLVKLHNNSSVYNVSQSELIELARNLQEQYDDKILIAARDEVVKYYANKALTIGVFLEKCAEHARFHQSLARTEQHLGKPKEIKKDVAVENIGTIKQMIQEAKAIKKLPYDKTKRVYSDNYNDAKLPRYEACTLDAPIWDKACYSDGPSLYAKCVAVGHILPFEVIQNAELKELYQKAWSKGLTREEKDRMKEVSKECGEPVVGLL